MNKRNILCAALMLVMLLSLLAMAAPRVAHASDMTSIDVDKTVWDGCGWVEEIEAEIGDDVRFRCVIHNDGTVPLVNIVVTDIVPDSLEYANNATVDGAPREPDSIAGNQLTWNFFGNPVGELDPCETITIEFDAHVVGYGEDINLQRATAVDTVEGNTVSGEDTATVNVPSPPLRPPAVPTLSQWGMIIMASLFAVLLVWTVRRRGLARRG